MGLSVFGPRMASTVVSHLGNLEEGLGDVNDTTEVLDALDALLDSGGVVLAGRVQDAGDLVRLLLRILSPGRSRVLGNGPEDGQERKGDNGLLVDDVELVANSGDTETRAGGEDGSLGEGAVAGDGYRVEDGLGLLLGVLLGQVGVVAGLDGDGGQGAERERWAETGGAYWGEHGVNGIADSSDGCYSPTALLARREAMAV